MNEPGARGVVLGLGAINWDCTFRRELIDDMGDDGMTTTYLVRPLYEGVGGSGVYALLAQQKLGAAALGYEVVCLGAVGTNEPGVRALQELEQAGVNTTGIRQLAGMETPRLQSILVGHDRRLVPQWPTNDANAQVTQKLVAQSLDDVGRSLVEKTLVADLGTFLEPSQLVDSADFLARLPAGVSACFSPGVYAYLKHPPAELDTVFRQSRYVFVDKEEVGKLTGITNNPERAGRTLLDRFPDCQAVIVTLAEGLEINPSSSYEVLHPSFQRKPTKVLTSLFIEHDKVTAVLAPEESNRPKVENVTNAGDVYRGTLQFYALLLGLPWPEATARADIGARFGISGFGLGRLATYDQIEERFCAEYGANPEATTLRARRR